MPFPRPNFLHVYRHYSRRELLSVLEEYVLPNLVCFFHICLKAILHVFILLYKVLIRSPSIAFTGGAVNLRRLRLVLTTQFHFF